MSVESYSAAGNPPSSPPNAADFLKTGPTPREVEELERRHRDRVHGERGKPEQAHRIQTEASSPSEPEQPQASAPADGSTLDLVV